MGIQVEFTYPNGLKIIYIFIAYLNYGFITMTLLQSIAKVTTYKLQGNIDYIYNRLTATIWY